MFKVYIYWDEASGSTVITSKDFGEIANEETPGWKYGNSYVKQGETDITNDEIVINEVMDPMYITFKGHNELE
jgi:hypothetical protein